MLNVVSLVVTALAFGLLLPLEARAACDVPSGAVALSSCVTGPGSDVVIGASAPGCEHVFVDRSYEGANALGTITIESGGAMVLADQTVADGGRVAVETDGILVGGTLELGNSQCPIGTTDSKSRAVFTFTGDRPCSGPEECSGRQKGIEVSEGGTLRLFGAKGVEPQGASWTHLRRPAGPEAYTSDQGVKAPVPAGGAKTLELERDVSRGSGAWEPGDWIVVATTSFSPFESEIVRIVTLETAGHGGARVTIDQPLQYYHFGGRDPGVPSPENFRAGAEFNYGVDERAEVGLLSRNLKLTAATSRDEGPSRNWGGELRFLRGFAEVSIQGVELEKFGKDQLGSYPIHFHMAGDVGNAPLVDSNSVHHSYNKCVTVHDTMNLTVSNNVCARVVGHMFYQEIGSEYGIRFQGNLGVGVMSNAFDVNAANDAKRQELLDEYWWTGDHLTNDPASPDFIDFDGLRVPNRDNQTNPTHGTCWELLETGGLGFKSDPVCADSLLYTEPASGFWIIHPGTELVGNSIAGCQGVGRGYWYVPPQQGAFRDLKFEPVGSFRNNRVHGCYAGLYNEPEYSVRSEQLFPHRDGTIVSPPIIGTFDGVTATRNRFRGIWMRPVWFTVKNARLATNRENATLVSSGGLDGNAPGVWSLIESSTIVGLSENNVDRFGPCPRAGHPVAGSGGFVGCIDRTAAPRNRVTGGDEVGQGYPEPHWNLSGVMIYDGPVRIFEDRFVNFHIDLAAHLTREDAEFLRQVRYPNGTAVYEGDAALGWFQSNQSSYPTATATRGLLFENVDLRHQIYTEKVNLGPFKDGDKNTAVLDLDGTLTGYIVVDENGNPIHDAFPISLNNLMFNAGHNSVDECRAEGAQDTVVEGRPTSLISPGNMATLEISALFPNPPRANEHWQDITLTKSSTEFGEHPTMTLQSRNGLGVWEPKVTSGYGYTVAAGVSTSPEAPRATQAGLPEVITLGVVDAVKPAVGPSNPFHVRLGLCYTAPNGGHPSGMAPFKITRGYKSYGGGNVHQDDPALNQYWNKLQNRYGGETCIDLDDLNRANLHPDTGCPAHGVTAVPDGGCPPGSMLEKDSLGHDACIYPKEELFPVSSIDELTASDGTPATDKFYYDEARGLLFLNVVQDFPNPVGPSPLGSCTGGVGDDPGCPDIADGETYYACPPQGCQVYRVEVTDGSYTPGPSRCDPYPTYEMEEPKGGPYLYDVARGAVVKRVARRDPKGEFDHYAPDAWPADCSPIPSSGGGGTGAPGGDEDVAVTEPPLGPVGVGRRAPVAN